MIIAAGATVVLATKDIDDVASKYMVEAGIMGVKRCKKSDLERIAKATGGQVLLTLANLEVGCRSTFRPRNFADFNAVLFLGRRIVRPGHAW